MSERRIGHLPIAERGRLVGIVTRTNLIRRQSISVAFMIGDINKAEDVAALKGVVDQVPQLLAQLVGAGVEAFKVGLLVTSVTDAVTKRLIDLAEAQARPAAGALSLARLRQPGPARADRHLGPGQLPHPRRKLRRARRTATTSPTSPRTSPTAWTSAATSIARAR